MPTIYLAIPRAGTGVGPGDAFRPDYRQGFPGTRVSIWRRHPTHVLVQAQAEQTALDDLRSKPGVRYLGASITDVRAWVETSGNRLAGDVLADMEPHRLALLNRKGDWLSNLYPTPLHLIRQAHRAQTVWTDADVLAMLAANPSWWPRNKWIRRVIAHFSLRHPDIKRLIGGNTEIAAEDWDSATAWTTAGGADNDWNFAGTGMTHSINSNQGRVTRNGADGLEIQWVNITDVEDSEASVDYTSSGNATQVGLVGRYDNAADDYYVGRRKEPTLTTGTDLDIFEVVAGSYTSLADAAPSTAISPGTVKLRIEDDGGAGTLVKFKHWSGAEPGWDLEPSADTGSLNGTLGDPGLWVLLQSSDARLIDFDNWTVDDLAAGAQSITPDPLAMVVTLVAPTVTATGSVTITPDPLAIVVTLVNPTASGTGPVTITPDPLAIPIVLVAPTLLNITFGVPAKNPTSISMAAGIGETDVTITAGIGATSVSIAAGIGVTDVTLA